MTNQLEALKQHSVIVADTGDLDAIARTRPQDATTNPSLILKAAQDARYRPLIDEALRAAAGDTGQRPDRRHAGPAVRRLSASASSSSIPGRVSTEVAARLSFDTEATEAKARRLIDLYEAAGVSREPDPDQDRQHLGRHPRGRTSRAGRHPLQPDAALQLRAGHRLRGRRRHADLAVRRTHLRLVQEGRRASKTSRARRTRAWRPSRASTTTTRSSATTPRSWARASARPTQILDLAGCDLLTISPDLLQKLEADRRRRAAAN